MRSSRARTRRARGAAVQPARTPLALKARDPMHPAPHTVRLAGLRATTLEPRKPPLIVERRDQDFVAGLLADLADETRRAGLPAATPGRLNGVLRLFQPVQRVFNLEIGRAHV